MQLTAWRMLILLTSALLLSACGAGGFSSFVATPPVSQYSAEVQDLAADELEAMGPPCPRDAVYGGCSAVKRLVMDYGWMREQARAAKGTGAE